MSGEYASSTDPKTWADFGAACHAAAERGWQVGYMLHSDDPFCCIDLDVKPDTPAADRERFESIIERFDSYTERSRSGQGWHVWVRGDTGGAGRKRDGVEVYSRERFIICTGDVARDRPVTPRQPLLNNMVSRMEPPPAVVVLTGDDCPDFAAADRAARDDGELGRLWRGEWQGRYPSQSEADLALAKLLLPDTGSLMECWRTLRLSALGQREKAGRPSYAASTMALACQHLAADSTSADHGRAAAVGLLSAVPADRPGLRLLVDGQLDGLPPLRWLVKGVIPDAGIGAIYGDSGTFKSFLTLDLLAHVSNGREWFGRRTSAAPAVYVPFEGQGGVPNRVRAWRLSQTTQRNPDLLMALDPDDAVRTNVAVLMDPLNLREAADREKLVAELTGCNWSGGILCIDTLAHACNGIDKNSSAMGEMIGVFRDLQRRLGGVILLVHHSGKDQSRGMRGWSGLHAAMDFVVECRREGDADSDARETSFRLSKVKDGTSGTSHGFRMEMVPLGVDEDGDPITSLVVRQAEAAEKPENPFKTNTDEAQQAADDAGFVEAWVRELVATGKRPSGRFLEAQRAAVRGRRNLTQKRLRDAVESLKGDGRLSEEQGGPSGTKWLRPIDLLPVSA